MIPADAALSSPALYINRELSLLEFQRRVLDEALDESNPLLERVKFLAIFGSNMDEFFMVRVSGIRKQVEAHIMEVFRSEEALDESNPLLERVKFLAIFGSNMDEFFMVRVSGIRKQVEAHIMEVFIDGLTPPEDLAATRKVSVELYESELRFLKKNLLTALDKGGIHLVDYQKLTEPQAKKADDYFNEVIYPVLT